MFQRWMLIPVAVGLIWLSFGAGDRRAVVSSWGGDPGAQAPVVGVAPQVGSLTGLFGRREPATTGLAAATQDPEIPWGNPTDSSAAVMTQGYGVGTHAPAETFGGLDIAIDGDGDGEADPRGSDGAPVYATHRGVVQVTPNSVPAGNHIWVRNDRYKTGYAHLKSFAVESGQVVERGELIAYMGSTGQSTGPHLDYQVWKDGINQNPLEYNPLP